MEHHMIARRFPVSMTMESNVPSRYEWILLVNRMVVAIRGNWLYCSRWRILRNGNTALAMDTDELLKLCFLPQRECLENTLWLGSIQTWSRRCFWKYRCTICSWIWNCRFGNVYWMLLFIQQSSPTYKITGCSCFRSFLQYDAKK